MKTRTSSIPLGKRIALEQVKNPLQQRIDLQDGFLSKLSARTDDLPTRAVTGEF
jgi:hypothetical protein